MNDKDILHKLLTFKSGQFVFSRKFESKTISDANIEATILYKTINDLPILPTLASQLDEEVIIRSIFGTAAIEGNPLKEQEVAVLLSNSVSPVTTKKVEREILNLKRAYDFADKAIGVEGDFQLNEDTIKEIHFIITDGIDYKNNIPGKYRNELVRVGNIEHGGIYTPPKIHDDIKILMREFITWMNSEEVQTCSFAPFARAVLAHYHLSLIHPFSDGNGRAARLIEGMLLKSAGIKYIPRMLSNYYYRNVDDYYWAFSNSIKSKSHDISPFVEFVLEGVVESLHEIRNRITFYIRKFSLRDYFAYLRKERKLTKRQHDLLQILLESNEPFTSADLFDKLHLKMLYSSVSERTAFRDIRKLLDMQLLIVADGKKYALNYGVLG